MLSEKTWKPDAAINLVAGLCFCMGLGALMTLAFLPAEAAKTAEGQFAAFVVGTVSLQGGALLCVSVFLRQNQMTWREAFGFANPRLARAIAFGIVMAAVMIPLTWWLNDLSMKIMNAIWLKPAVQTTVQTLQSTKAADDRLYFGLATVLVAPLVEEMIFRGILYPIVKQLGFPRLAVWGTSLLFALFHFNIASMLPLFVLSLSLIFLYEKTNNLAAPMATHALFNLVNFLAIIHPEWMSGYFKSAS